MNLSHKSSLPLLLHFTLGLATALIATVLIYFKQKPILHHVIVLSFVGLIYLSAYFLKYKHFHISNAWKVTFLIFIIFLEVVSPQFLYQFRPYTFYISGLAMFLVFLLATPTLIVSPIQNKNQYWYFGAFIAGYSTVHIIPFTFSQYLLWSLAMLSFGFFMLKIQLRPIFKTIGIAIVAMVGFISWEFYKPIAWFDEQVTYEDKIVFSAKTQFHHLVVTQWHHDYWFFIDKLKNLSSIDEYLYYEPMVHAVFAVSENQKNALVVGGENGCLLREVLKYDQPKRVDIVSYDTLLRNMAAEHPLFTNINHDAYANEKVHTFRGNMLKHLTESTKKYDLVFLDLPDPRSVETNQYYTIEFYDLIRNLLSDTGVMIAQAGSPYFATDAFDAIGRTLQKAGFNTLPIHNQILTLGEWGWYICSKDQPASTLRAQLVAQEEPTVATRWYNQEAALLISSFGKTDRDTSQLGINTIANPLVYRYYLQGNWDLD